MTKRSKPFQRTIATPRIDPDFETWMDAFTPRSIAERQRIPASDA